MDQFMGETLREALESSGSRAAAQRSPRPWALEGGAVSADLFPGQQHPNWPIFSAPFTPVKGAGMLGQRKAKFMTI